MSTFLGYNQPLFILAFDHRNSFIKNFLQKDGNNLTEEELKTIIDLKKIIYDGFKSAVNKRLPKEDVSILVDEKFGDEILKDAKVNNFNIIIPTEKSGQESYDFEHGDLFQEHIEKYQPTFVKALVRYNPENDNDNQLTKLKILHGYCQKNNYKLLIELLVPASAQQLKKVENDKSKYDKEIRPWLTIKSISKFQKNNIEPDVWKLEGVEEKSIYTNILKQIREEGRSKVGLVVLGRGENKEKVIKWLEAAKNVDGVIGFAIGRTIFNEALQKYLNNQILREEAVFEIEKNYIEFYDIFNK